MRHGLYRRDFGFVEVALAAVATRTGARARAYKRARGQPDCATSPASTDRTASTACHRRWRRLRLRRHARRPPFRAPRNKPIEAGKHVLIEKPSVLSLRQLDELVALARQKQRAGQGRLPQALRPRPQEAAHARRRRRAAARQQRLLLAAGAEEHLGGQFAEWIAGRNPGTYVAVHYLKLIDFTFGGRLKTVACTGQRGIVGPGRRPHLGLDAAAADLRIPRRPRGRVRHPHELGHARQLSRATSSRRSSSASTTASGTPTRGSAASNDGRGPHADASEDHAQQPLQRRRSSSRGASGRSAATASRSSSGSSRKSRPSNSAAPQIAAHDRLEEMRALATTIWPPTAQVVAAVQAMEAILAHAADGRAGRRRAHCD